MCDPIDRWENEVEQSNAYRFDKIAFGNEIESSSNGVLHRLLDQLDIELIDCLIRCEETDESTPVVLEERRSTIKQRHLVMMN